jgi:hypothetical protein
MSIFIDPRQWQSLHKQVNINTITENSDIKKIRISIFGLAIFNDFYYNIDLIYIIWSQILLLHIKFKYIEKTQNVLSFSFALS